MLASAEQETEVGRNHPLALRIGIIAFLNQAITVGCIWGSFSSLLKANEARLGIDREMSTLAIPLMMLIFAGLAPVVGILATKYPMRIVTLSGSILSAAGFLVLALTNSYPFYLAAFGLLLGPGLAVATVMPSTLVTRWFNVNRGRALGFANIPAIFPLMPLGATWALHAYGVQLTYLMLACLAMVTVIANLFISDPPAAATGAAPASVDTVVARGSSMIGVTPLLGLLRNKSFWILAIGANVAIIGSLILTTHMVPMAISWGNTATAAATLQTAFSLVSLAGPIFFGWLTDKLGGPLTLALLVLDSAVLWGLLLVRPSFSVLLVIFAMIGFHAVGAAPTLSMSLSEVFEKKDFSRAYGMANLVALPFTVVSVPIASFIFMKSGSYYGVILMVVSVCVVAFPVVLSVRRTPRLPVVG